MRSEVVSKSLQLRPPGFALVRNCINNLQSKAATLDTPCSSPPRSPPPLTRHHMIQCTWGELSVRKKKQALFSSHLRYSEAPEKLTFKDTMNCLSSKSSLLSALLALSCSIISCKLLARFWHMPRRQQPRGLFERGWSRRTGEERRQRSRSRRHCACGTYVYSSQACICC